MKQYEAVAQAMKNAGGYATLGHLYCAALKVPGCDWGTKTPFASIRRIVQTRPEFFKIRPGLWGLAAERAQILEKLSLPARASPRHGEAFDHSYYQGLLVEIGNLKRYDTCVPAQDQNRYFLNRTLKEVASRPFIYDFTFEPLIRRARTVDVIWFNHRHFPDSFFEVEHSTNMRDALVKYMDFQDFRLRYFIVADAARRREFDAKIKQDVFEPIQSRVSFMTYDAVSHLHSRLSESVALERDLNMV